jgi:hypothetical protein
MVAKHSSVQPIEAYRAIALIDAVPTVDEHQHGRNKHKK